MDDFDMDEFNRDNMQHVFNMHVFDSDEADELMNHINNLKKNLTVVTLKSGIQLFISEEGTIMLHGYDEADFGSKDEVDTFPEGLTQANTLLQKFML